MEESSSVQQPQYFGLVWLFSPILRPVLEDVSGYVRASGRRWEEEVVCLSINQQKTKVDLCVWYHIPENKAFHMSCVCKLVQADNTFVPCLWVKVLFQALQSLD